MMFFFQFEEICRMLDEFEERQPQATYVPDQTVPPLENQTYMDLVGLFTFINLDKLQTFTVLNII